MARNSRVKSPNERRPRPGSRVGPRLLDVYRLLYQAYGPQSWWPGETPFEVIIGAILTQSVAWTNVAKAIAGLKAADLMSPAALRDCPTDRLAGLLRPCLYFNAKAVKLKAMVDHLARYDDDPERWFDQDVPSLRTELLGIHGVGEETADSIVLYAAGKPSFVIDAYTRRIFKRLELAPGLDTYRAYQARFEDELPADVALFNEYHALLVRLGKNVCRTKPRCPTCPLLGICPTGQRAAAS